MTANITDISRLQATGNAYKVFNSMNKDNIVRAEAAVFSLMEEIIRTKNILEHRLEDANDNMNRCIYALSACRSRIEYDEEGRSIPPNCSCEERDLEDARREKQAAQNCVDQMNRYLRILEEQKKAYDAAKAKFQNLMDNTNQNAIAHLEKLHSIAVDYINTDF